MLGAVSAANRHLPTSIPTFGCPNQLWHMAVQSILLVDIHIFQIDILRMKVGEMHLPPTFTTTKRGGAPMLRAVSAANKHLPTSLPTFGCPNQRWRMAVQQPATPPPPELSAAGCSPTYLRRLRRSQSTFYVGQLMEKHDKKIEGRFPECLLT